MKFSLKKLLTICVTASLSIILMGCGSDVYMEEAIAEVDTLMTDLGFENGDVFRLIDTFESVDIVWESTDEDIIGSNGVVNSVGLNTDVEVMIFVTFTEGDVVEERSYFVMVYKIDVDITDPDPVTNPDLDRINLVKNSLVLATTTRSNLNLITLSNGVTLSWSSNNQAITSEGVVTRSEDLNIEVRLTVTLSSGAESDTKVFTVIVEREDVLTEAKNSLVLPTSTAVNLTLPQRGGKNDLVSIAWSSNNSSVLSQTGFITRSLTEDRTVILTATLTYKDQTPQTRNFEVVILKDTVMDEVILGVEFESDVFRNLSLPVLIEGVSIAWQSNNQAITTLGVVTRGSTDTSVTLTATFSYASTERVVTYDLIVKAAAANRLPAPVGFVNQGAFFAYAPYSHIAYSGEMSATFSATGQNTLIFTAMSSQGVFTLSELDKQKLTAGVTYTVVFNALADTTNPNWGDSLPSAPLSVTIPISTMNPLGPLTETESGFITWDHVLTAEYYEIHVTLNSVRTLRATLLSTDNLTFLLPTEIGVYLVEVTARAVGFSSSTRSIAYSIASSDAVALNAPVISLDNANKRISWSAITGATGYKIIVGNEERTISGLSYDLSGITPQMGSFSVTVIALGDVVTTKDSLPSNALSYEMDKALEPVDASGLILQVNVAGHYSIEKPAIFNPTGWDASKYIIEIYSNGQLVRTRQINNGGTVVHFQLPADPNGLLFGLTPGSYTIHIIMVGNGTTHINSAPFIRTFTFAG